MRLDKRALVRYCKLISGTGFIYTSPMSSTRLSLLLPSRLYEAFHCASLRGHVIAEKEQP
jgi:hypothetical protein